MFNCKAWIDNNLIPVLKQKYVFKMSSFKDGDFGDLERIEFEGLDLMGTVDLWSLGWLDIHMIDAITVDEIMNYLVEPEKEELQKKVLSELADFLMNK